MVKLSLSQKNKRRLRLQRLNSRCTKRKTLTLSVSSIYTHKELTREHPSLSPSERLFISWACSSHRSAAEANSFCSYKPASCVGAASYNSSVQGSCLPSATRWDLLSISQAQLHFLDDGSSLDVMCGNNSHLTAFTFNTLVLTQVCGRLYTRVIKV